VSRRMVLCEGPDDVAALREIAMGIFGAVTPRPGVAWAESKAGAAGQARGQLLLAGRARIEIRAVKNAKSQIAKALATELAQLPPQVESDGELRTRQVAALFDPDDEGAERFFRDVEREVKRGATAWRLTELRGGVWMARRQSGERLLLRAVPWRGPGSPADGLADHQNLERLLCAIAARAYPAEAAMVERWLTEMSRMRATPPGWKAALHLWCALVEEKASDANAAARFLHQNKVCLPCVEPALREVSLLRDLRPLFAAR
jgi:hypothetical protein